MDITEFREEHYPIVEKWWRARGWVPPGLQLLPRKGYICVYDSKFIASAFVYTSCSGMSYMDWVISNPETTREERAPAIKAVVKACKEYAREQGYQVLYTVTANKHLQEIYREIGFSDMERNATTMAMTLTDTSLDFLREEA